MNQPNVFDCGGARPGSPIPHALRKAVDYIRRDVGRRMSVADLATHCGLPERTLRKQFQDFMGASPLEFWRRARLAAVRDHLLRGANDISVMDTAARFGFNHFGRFSQQYRSYFAEPPSATLFRSRLAERQRIGQIREAAMDGDHASVDTGMSRERPSVAILSCQVSATEPDCRSFGDYLTEGIAVALCRSRSLSVAVPTSTRAGSADAKPSARDLGARYVVATRIAQTGNRMRIFVRLLDTTTDFMSGGIPTTARPMICWGCKIGSQKASWERSCRISIGPKSSARDANNRGT